MSQPIISAAEDFRTLQAELASMHKRRQQLATDLATLDERIYAKSEQVGEAKSRLLDCALA